MNSKLILAALLIVGTIPFATAPFASANHFSIGNQDSVGVSATENAENPSVPTSSDLWARGTGQVDCTEFDPSGDLDKAADEGTASTTADTFCNRLIYNTDEGQGDFTQQSPADQDYPVTNDLVFDMVWTSYVGNYGLSTCLPVFCTVLPGGPLVFSTAHDAGAAAGLTENGTEASKNEEADRFQQYAINLQYPNAGLVAQEATGGTGDSNGWLLPTWDQSIQAFLQTPDNAIDTSGDGNIDDAELATWVEQLKSDSVLSEDNNAQVCAFKPGNTIVINAPQPTFCEVLFKWYDEDGEVGEDTTFDEYSDPCDSPTYVCGANQPGWYALLVMGPEGEMTRTDLDYEVWHGVVAPAPLACSGAEPGFDFDAPTGISAPYIAHDLDIYEPVTRDVGFDSGEAVIDWQEAAEDNVTSQVDQAEQMVLDQLPDGLTGPVTDTSYVATKDVTVEPNTAEGDTSQSLAGAQADTTIEELQRVLEEDPCAAFGVSGEQAADPWVDYIDGIVWQNILAGGISPLEIDPTANQYQDRSNTEAPSVYYTAGQIGMFTDKDDSGAYEQADSGNKFTAIDTAGAYPLFWDMFLEDSDGDNVLEPATDIGCSTGFGDTKLTGQMVDAGYMKHTGLLQVVYLTEPSVLIHDGEGFVSAPSLEPTAYVFLSQGLQELREVENSPVLAQAVSNALAKLPGGAPDNVVYASDLINSQSDFLNQCQQDTGGFSNAWSFSHTCETGCAGDTIVTSYVFQLEDGTIGGGELPTFDPDADGTPFNFDENPVGDLLTGGVHQWYDVDPFDGDETRNNAESSAPPTE